MRDNLTAHALLAELQAHRSEARRQSMSRQVRNDDGTTQIIGVRMKTVFDTAKAATNMPLDEVETLLESPYYEVRVAAVSILDFKARRKRIDADEREALYELFLRRHDRINNWVLVDRAAPRVVGWYLLDKPRDVLYQLAQSPNIWERRTAITATFWFIRQGQVDDTLRIAEILLHDDEDLINKPVGTGLREVRQVDRARLLDFIELHARDMPRVTLRYAVEKLDVEDRQRLLRLAKS